MSGDIAISSGDGMGRYLAGDSTGTASSVLVLRQDFRVYFYLYMGARTCRASVIPVDGICWKFLLPLAIANLVITALIVHCGVARAKYKRWRASRPAHMNLLCIWFYF